MIGNGCKIAYSLASPVSWVNIPNLVDMTIPVMTSDRVDKTVHSTTSNLKRTEPGLDSVADASFTILQDLGDATQIALRQLQEARTKVWIRQEVPTNDAKTLHMGVEYEGRIADFKVATPIGGEQTTQYSVMFDGDDLYWDGAEGASQIV